MYSNNSYFFRNKDAKTVRSAGSDGQKISRRSQDGQRLRQKAGSDSQHTRSQKQDKRPNREAVETQEQSSVVSINSMISFIL